MRSPAHTWCAVTLTALVSIVRAADPVDFDLGWKFHLGDVAGAESPAFNDRDWRAVDLPHDWSNEIVRDDKAPDGQSAGYAHGGVGWYRKQFTLDANATTPAADLIFDGIQQDSEVWINGHALGLQPHGYVGFVRTITPFLKPPGESNVVAVRALNPEFNTRWYSGSGVYRHVQLRRYGAVDVATWGLQLSTLWVKDDAAQIQTIVDLTNASDVSADASLSIHLRAPDGSDQKFDLGRLRLGAHGHERVAQPISVKKPQLWSLDTPNLYVATVEIRQGDNVVASATQTVGIRTIDVSATQGFRLNGQTVELKGGCLHHDNGLLGAAAFDAAEWRRVRLMKENGFNAIRTSHNPPSTAFLDACDRLGVLVIDEFADVWEMPKKPNGYSRYFAEHWRDDLRSFLHRDFNHPSVVIWSIGNEIPERAQPSGLEIARQMIAEIHAYDTSRPITNAICDFWDNPQFDHDWSHSAPAFALLDVGGYNYKDQEYESDHAKHPDRVMVGTESYPMHAYENWRLVQRHPYVIGDFVWTGMDHRGESGIGHTLVVPVAQKREWTFFMPWPTYLNFSGDIDIGGNKKPQSFYRDVVWDRSVVEMMAHPPIPAGQKEEVGEWGWPDELPSWNWSGREGQPFQVRVFSKASRVRLEFNGKTLGERAIDAEHGIVATFDVPYSPGELKATAFDANGKVLGSRVLATTGKAATLALVPETTATKAGRGQVVYVPIDVRDNAGKVVNDAAIPLAVSVSGAAELVAFGSANPATDDFAGDDHTQSWHGHALLVVRSTGKPGIVHVSVSSEGLPAAEAQLELK